MRSVYLCRETEGDGGILKGASLPGLGPHNNAVAESYFASLKKDEIYESVYEGLEGLAPSIEKYIHFYSVNRPHYTLGMRPSCQIETQFYDDQK